MHTNKQRLLLEYMVGSPDTFALCRGIIKPEYFDPEYRSVVVLVEDYYEKYNSLPSLDVIESETTVLLEQREITYDKIHYCTDEVVTFCKQKAIESAITGSIQLLKDHDYGSIEKMIVEAVTISLNEDLGTAYFEDPEQRIQNMLETEQAQSTGWTEVDKQLNGGIHRKQLQIFSANSGGGKSLVMQNLMLNLAEQGLTALYITLELSESMVSQRLDSMVTNISQTDWRNKSAEIVEQIQLNKNKYSDITIKYSNIGTTPNQLRGYLKEFELKNRYSPDVVIIDYMQLMDADERIPADNVFLRDKIVSEQLRKIANESNCFMITASQQNRKAVDNPEVNQASIAGGISKIDTADNVISILANDITRAHGEIQFKYLKTRSSDGVGKITSLQWHNASLRILNTKQQHTIAAQPEPDSVVVPSTERSVFDIFDEYSV